ncbi:hypothetical protein C7M84_021329 [Penaeus vannamei]|uniref:Uncharacterized protein n=1 Tax=Penaeus vannamei TaxID=6689 RepID=A0A3R7MSX7_PENVA|nr:hypothetical protein C7M84_021329 [Penaeus vannamei]
MPQAGSDDSRQHLLRSRERRPQCHLSASAKRGSLTSIASPRQSLAQKKKNKTRNQSHSLTRTPPPGQHFDVDFGGNSGPARVVIDEREGTVFITPAGASHPHTLVDLRKGVVVYIVDRECLGVVVYIVDRECLVRSEVGRHLAAWCQQRPTWRLSRRRPSLPSYRDYLRKYAANQTAVAGGAHFRRKRRAGRRPRLHRPARRKPRRRGDCQESGRPPGGPVPSFVRNEEDGQGFRHYRDFYHNSDGDLDAEESAPAPVRPRSKPKTKSRARLRSRIDIPETIVKDGQIFYRYDAEIDSGRNKKDQSKRSHQGGQEYLESVDGFAATSDNHIPDATPDLLVDGPLGAGDYGGGVLVDHNLIGDDYPLDLQGSHVQTQAQMGGGNHAASAGAQMDSGPAVQVRVLQEGSSQHRLRAWGTRA